MEKIQELASKIKELVLQLDNQRVQIANEDFEYAYNDEEYELYDFLIHTGRNWSGAFDTCVTAVYVEDNQLLFDLHVLTVDDEGYSDVRYVTKSLSDILDMCCDTEEAKEIVAECFELILEIIQN